MTLFLIFLAGVLDRIRGTEFHILGFRAIDKLVYGWIIGLLMGVTGWPLVPFAALFAIGVSIGFGEPIGMALEGKPLDPSNREWWQIVDNAWLALAFRGALTGLPLTLLIWWIPAVWIIATAFSVAFPLAVLIAKYLPFDKWETQEYMRGWIGAGLIATYMMGAT